MGKLLIETKRLFLRLSALEDVAEIIRYYKANQAYFAPYHPLWPPEFFSEQLWQERVQLYEQEFWSGNSVRLFIFAKDKPNQIIGNVNLTVVLRGTAQSCNLGYNLAEAAQNQGFMHEALTGVLEFAFSDLNLHRVMAQYMPRNERSGKVLKKLGFTIEGYARDYLLIAGQWEDHILTSLTNPNWKFK